MPRHKICAFPPTPALRFEAGWRTAITRPYCGFHDHLHFEMVYHPTGSGTTTLHDGTRIPFTEDSVVIYPPHLRHDQRVCMPATDVCILFSAAMPTPAVLTTWRHIPSVKDRYCVGEIAALGHPLPSLSGAERVLYDLRVTTLVAHLTRMPAMSPDAPTTAPAGSYADAAMLYIREHYRDIDRLEQVALAIGISYDHLRHEFKRRFRTSAKQCVLAMRLEEARALLANSVLPLKTIARLCGFDNERYFCTCFRVREGKTPGEFRRSRRQTGESNSSISLSM